ncbi:unnamed protein product [Meloidogyne enterolobii]|uniref:Uncharacterized protein n=1 Tax=Meloidogyne enterolobii TaxID=390850 RepID=A0ACB0YW92_MELEN
MEDQWFVQGSLNMNRAVHGDVVVAQLLPESEWTAPEKTIRLRDAEETQNEGDNLPDADGEEEDDQEEDLEDSEAPEMKGKKGFLFIDFNLCWIGGILWHRLLSFSNRGSMI